MNALSTAILAFSMSADAFAVAAGKGAALQQPKPTEALRIGAIFGAVESSTAVIGWGLGAFASSFVTSFDHWIAFFILVALGIKMIAESFLHEAAREKPKRQKLRALIFAAIGSSIDSLGVGVTLAFIDVNIWATAAAIGSATFLMATIGAFTGHMIGSRTGKIAEILGGTVLIAIGTKILLQHTAVI
ncbi:MAG: manganese efflux pump MntP family protein [Alphaproteobacteria bacterium]|nr:manganese efflux pump MntP family protein [Alphaproteobacteria bacterium]